MPQSPTVELPKRLPLVIQPENRDDSTLKDAKLVNAYVERSETGDTWIVKRPGLLQGGLTLSGNGLGVYNWNTNIFAVFGTTLYKDEVSVGTVSATGGVYRFNQCLGATHKLQLSNGVNSYNYDSGGGLVAMSGVNLPSPAVKGIIYIDGTTYMMNSDAGIRGCAVLNDPTDWSDAANALVAQIEPDKGVFLAKQLVYAVAMKEWSSEVFYDAGNATGSPLGAVQGAKINYGCVNQDSVQEIDGVLFWLATNRSAAVQVVMLEGLKLRVVSTKAVERLLTKADFSSVYSFSLKYEGHRFYIFTLVNENLTLAYDLTDNAWAQWTDSDGDYFPVISSTYNSSQGTLLQHATNGKLYVVDAAYYNDDGSVITVDVYTPNFDGGVRLRGKQMMMMEFIGDQTPGSVLQVRWNDNDYAADKWTNFRGVDMGLEQPMLDDCGTFKRRAHHIRHQSNTRMRLQAVELQMDLATS